MIVKWLLWKEGEKIGADTGGVGDSSCIASDEPAIVMLSTIFRGLVDSWELTVRAKILFDPPRISEHN